MTQTKVELNVWAFICLILVLLGSIGFGVYAHIKSRDTLITYMQESDDIKEQALSQIDSLTNLISGIRPYNLKLKQKLNSSKPYEVSEKEYNKLDTPDRVHHFYKWLSDSTERYDKVSYKHKADGLSVPATRTVPPSD